MKEHFPFKNDWLINNKIFNDAIDTIENEITVNREYDIPYVAGYSKDGKTIYIDRDMPKSFKNKSGKIIDTDKFLVLHEVIEKTILLRFKTIYQLAHQIAFRLEEDAVKVNKIDLKEYNTFMNKYIKKIGDLDKYSKIPKDLDIEPYRDEKDFSTLEKMVNHKSFKDYIKKD